uniref:Adenylate kinase isoenzyme 6 homolog n=1 Tax=Timema californicum TaxID=61474 RepID=A0A7R9JAD9_TIMCA|nr:unnamed protein product [Timema californicum]
MLGTPGVGKSTLAMQLAEKTGLEWLEVSRVAQQLGCLQEYDEVYQCPVLDEDKLLDNMEFMMGPGGKIVDYHGCDFFPERWFDIVFVLRTNNTLLYDRLTNRGYKVQECEIFQTILEEAQRSYKEEIVHQLSSNTPEEMEDNLNKMVAWVDCWRDSHKTSIS